MNGTRQSEGVGSVDNKVGRVGMGGQVNPLPAPTPNTRSSSESPARSEPSSRLATRVESHLSSLAGHAPSEWDHGKSSGLGT